VTGSVCPGQRGVSDGSCEPVLPPYAGAEASDRPADVDSRREMYLAREDADIAELRRLSELVEPQR
jgi:hypothetical protein